MAFTDPNAPIIAREFATDTPPHKRVHINGAGTPNGIGFYTGDSTETLPGIIQPASNGPGLLRLDMQAPLSNGSGARPFVHLATDGTPNGGVAEVGADTVAILSPSIHISNAKQILSDEIWTPLPLVNGWIAVGASVPRYRIDVAGNTHIQGRVSSGTTGVIATLPLLERPTQLLDFPLKSNNDASSVSWIQVNTSGTINVVGNVPAAQVWLALNITYSQI